MADTLPPDVIPITVPEAARFTLRLSISAADMQKLDGFKDTLVELPGTIQPAPLTHPLKVTLSRQTPAPPAPAVVIAPAPVVPAGGVAADGAATPAP